MDYKTKAYYRNKIKEISKRTKISELYIAQKALELAQINENSNKEVQTSKQTEANSNVDIACYKMQEKKSHIGYYLISNGINELYKTLQTNKKPKKEKRSVLIYILSITIFSILISGFISYYTLKITNLNISILIFLLTIIPSSQIATDIIQCILNKIIKPSLIPKMDYSERNTRRMFYNGYNSECVKIA